MMSAPKGRTKGSRQSRPVPFVRPKYITLQPPLSREAWTASVTKMRTTYGGPIPEEQVPKIVDYLVAINGAK